MVSDQQVNHVIDHIKRHWSPGELTTTKIWIQIAFWDLTLSSSFSVMLSFVSSFCWSRGSLPFTVGVNVCVL